MMTIRRGDFWVADTPFTEGSASKKRPARTLSEVKGKERDFANPRPLYTICRPRNRVTFC